MTLESFTALDFETATWSPTSICQIGIVRVEDGITIQRVNQLIRPPNNAYFHKNIEVHGIQPSDTEFAPDFWDYWGEIKPLIEDQIIVAHNSSFDVNCLRSTLEYYDLAQPNFEERCTRKIFKRGLKYLTLKYKIPLNHHDALSDANACAQLYLIHLRRGNLPKTGDLFADQY